MIDVADSYSVSLAVAKYVTRDQHNQNNQNNHEKEQLMTDIISIVAGPFSFRARLETELAPATCRAFRDMLPYEERLIHVRWSGEGLWIPMGDRSFDLPWENNTSYPAPGQFIFYPKGISETEILLAYGGVHFASKAGQLSGNHFLSIFEGLENIAELGRMTLWQGAQPIRFALAAS